MLRSFNSISKVFGMGIISAITAMSLVVESRLLQPIQYSQFNLPIKIPGTGIPNSMDESLYLAKDKGRISNI